MNKEKMISVVLPVYNGADFIEKSIDSILKQTYDNLELIIVNDCSTDMTLDIISKYQLQDPRVKIINNAKNMKLPSSLNIGFAQANGAYYTWTSHDNLYKANAFEVLVKALENSRDIDLVYTDFTYIDSNGSEIGTEYLLEPEDIIKCNVCGACFLYTRKIAQKVGDYDRDLFLAEDYDYWIRIYSVGNLLHLKSENMYYYRRHPNSLTETKQTNIMAQTYRVFKKHFDFLYNTAIRTNNEIVFWDRMYEYAVGNLRYDAEMLIMRNASFKYKKYYCHKNIMTIVKKIISLYNCMISNLRTPLYNIVDQRVNAVINNQENAYKYVHIIHNDKFCCSFVKFINEQFDKNEHLFIVTRAFTDLPFPSAENVYEFHKLQNLDFYSPKIEKIIVHSLFGGQMNYWANHIDILQKKAYWMIWGADLYEAPRTENDDLVRKSFYGYISDTDGDCSVVKEKYQLGDNKHFINAAYTFPITIQMIENARNDQKAHKYVRIQINNSCDWSIIDMLKRLSRFKDEKLKIVCILSYGEGERCKQEIIKTGSEIFGDKFEYLDKLCNPQDYAHWLVQNDIYILNQNRQQGLGNSLASLALGAKLFIKSSVTTYHHFNNKGIKVYDTSLIDKMTFEDLIRYEPAIRKKNQNKVRRFFDNRYLKKLWEPVFNDSKL